MKKLLRYFTLSEKVLWSSSVALILLSFVVFDRENYFNLASSLIGITSLIFCAKGNPIGQVMMIVFCIVYGIISYSFSYWGEMITYVFMSLPMAVISLISWKKNPYKDNKDMVAVRRLCTCDIWYMLLYSFFVSVIFYFILRYLNTANLYVSTFSITTSFAAVYLTSKRSPYYAIAYAINDIVLIVLWTLATLEDLKYVSVIVCFVAFLVNDIYGYINWKRMEKFQLDNQ